MSVKILGGFARGQVLDVPKGDLIRPTSVMLKRRIFDFYQDLSDVYFADLCAGSGAVAFEAWSRGATRVYVNEINKHVMIILQKNTELLILKHSHRKCGEIVCSNESVEKWIVTFRNQYQQLSANQQEETIIFLDPPYSKKEIYTEVLNYLIKEEWFIGQLWIESDRLKGLGQKEIEALGLVPQKIFEQGDSFIFVTNFPPQR